MENNSQLLENLFDSKILRIIRLFLVNKERQFYLQEISKKASVPIASTFRIVRKLANLDIIREIRIRKFRLYQCANNENISFLETFLKQGKRIIDSFVGAVSKIGNIEQVILYGKEEEKKANILLIGRNIDSSRIKQVANDFKEKYSFIITYLCLEREQYEQMSAMGLYSGKKKMLFRR
ncbi:hypothetical protein GF323_05260 [Candidatus Woesearchaeota archaeon]|nr:hypothetical protein [Candidatus Woesearchaeota archaeon]